MQARRIRSHSRTEVPFVPFVLPDELSGGRTKKSSNRSGGFLTSRAASRHLSKSISPLPTVPTLRLCRMSFAVAHLAPTAAKDLKIVDGVECEAGGVTGMLGLEFLEAWEDRARDERGVLAGVLLPWGAVACCPAAAPP